MINITDITGLASAAAAIAASATLIPWVRRLSPPRRALLFATVAVLALVPVTGTAPAVYVRGVIGDLSITTLLLLLGAMFPPVLRWPAADRRSQLALYAIIVLLASVLYPLALGIGMFDPYRLGYGNPWFLTALLLLALSAWYERLYPIALCLALAVFAWTIGWYESTNLWDYLLDPLVSLYAGAALILRAARWLGRHYRNRQQNL